MDTTKNTHRIAVIAALAAAFAAGLGGCAGTVADASTQRLTVDTSHERERALNRLRAHAPQSAYQDQAERRMGFAPPSGQAAAYPDQIDRRPTIAG